MTIASESAHFTRSLLAAIMWPVGALIVTAVLLVLLIFELFEVIKWSDHSYEVLLQTRLCENRVVAAQNELRGYLLTGDLTLIHQLQDQGRSIDRAYRDLRALVSDNPEQIIRADGLIQAETMWLQHANATRAQEAQGTPPTSEWNQMGASLTTDLQSKFDTFSAVEEGLREQRLKSVRRMKQAVSYAGGFLVTLLGLTIGYSVRKQLLQLEGVYQQALNNVELRYGELKRSEADLEAQKEWFRVTLKSIGDGVIVTDPEGRIVFMNHEAERLTDWTIQKALLKPMTEVFQIIHEETRAAVEDPVTCVFREKKVVAMANHTLLISRSGDEWPIEDSAAPIFDAKGTLLGVVMVFHDATDVRRARQTLTSYSANLEKQVADRTTTLQQAVAELESFSYTVSHDLRSPLRTMQGFADAIQEDYGDKLDARGLDYLQRIKNAAVRLDRLIRDLLSYTRISRQNALLEATDLDRLVHDIIETYPNLSAPPTVVKIEGKLPRVMAQETVLTLVLSNLLGNAAKFVPSGVAPQIRLWAEARENNVRLWIEDNGIGIDPRDTEKIFQMFVKLHDATTYDGTGMGLAIVKKAVETMRGEVGVVSGEGTGSKFWVELMKAST